MNAVQARRLLELAAFLRTIHSSNFHFGILVQGDVKAGGDPRRRDCGALACALGWTPAVFPRLVKWKRNNPSDNPYLVCDGSTQVDGIWRKLFGLTMDEAAFLFYPDGLIDANRTCPLRASASPKQVADHLEAFARDRLRELAWRHQGG